MPFGIKTDDRRRHMYIVGKTGMGKSTLMENMVIQDMINGKGIALVDPHGDLVEKILDYVPNNRVNDVVYFNPADIDYPIAFNILESVDTRYKHLVASGLMGVFTKIWANMWSARMEYILNNSILALLDSPGNTLLGINRLLLDKKYRKKIVDNVKDPIVRSFWVDEYANWTEKFRTEAIASIQNKVGQFLSSGVIRNIVGQSKSTIDMREMMDNKKILLMNLSKGRVGEDNSALLGAMAITKLQLAALSRVDIPEANRQDFYLYVDEFQNFATDSFATILSEARKYRLCLTIGHQYIGQLIKDKNTNVRDAVFGNVGTMVTFRVGAADAEYLEKEFNPTFTENDLVNLPRGTVILKLMINGVASEPFTAVTFAPGTYPPTGNAEKVIRVSRERYAHPIKTVEEKIFRWMGEDDYHEQSAVVAAAVKPDSMVDEDEEAQPAAEAPQAPAASFQERYLPPVAANVASAIPVAPALKPEDEAPLEVPHLQTEAPPAHVEVAPIPMRSEAPGINQPRPAPRQFTERPREPQNTPNRNPQPRENTVRRDAPRRDMPQRNANRNDGPRRDQGVQNTNQQRRPAQGKPQGKPANSIWDQVSKINEEKERELKQREKALLENLSNDVQKLEKVVDQEIKTAAMRTQSAAQDTEAAQTDKSPAPSTKQPISDHNEPIVLKPGQTQKINVG